MYYCLIWARKTGFHKKAKVRKNVKEISEAEHHFRRFNEIAEGAFSSMLSPISRLKKRIRRIFHRELEDEIWDMQKELDKVKMMESKSRIPKIRFKSAEEWKKPRVNRKFETGFDKEMNDLEKKLGKIKNGREK